MKRVFVLILLLAIGGCAQNEGDNTKINVPLFSTMPEYVKWAKENDVEIKVTDSKGNVVTVEEEGYILEVKSETVSKGDTLEFTICEKGTTCTLILENDPMKNNKQD